VVVSDFLDPAGFERGVRALLERRFDVHLVHVLDPEEMNPTLGGDLRLIDSETGDVRDLTADAEALRGYRDRLRAFLERVEGFAGRRSVPPVTTDTPVEACRRAAERPHARMSSFAAGRPPLRSRSRWCCSTSSRCGGASARSSLMFWEAVQRDREASTFFQRLQRDPLLICRSSPCSR
jgi:hypothetical protein